MSSASKGADFERAQARLLSLWVSNGADKDLLWRTGMSGGRHTIGALVDHGYGDLQVLKPTLDAIRFMNTFCVELKHYKVFELFSEWFNQKSNLVKWWTKLVMEAKANKVAPMLIVKPNLKPAMVFFDFDYISTVASPRWSPLLSNCLVLSFGGYKIIGFIQSDFISLAKLTDFPSKVLRKPS